MLVLRDDQIKARIETQQAFLGARAVILRAPTGFGKTVVASDIIDRALAKGRRVQFVTPRIEINRQAENTFSGKGVRVACKQSLIRHGIDCDLLIDDEAHYGMSDAWAARMNEHIMRGGWVLGLTASPIPGMDRVYQKVVHGPPVRWLIENGHLSRFRAFGPSKPDLSSVPIYAGEYAKGELCDLMSKPVVVGRAVDSWNSFARGLRTIGYCVSREHSRRIVGEFRAAGIRAEHIDGSMSEAERLAIINRFADRETEWLGSVDLVTLGFDMSSQLGRDCPIEAMQDLCPGRSLPRHVQKCGRVLRKKDFPAIIVDNAGNLERLGLPDEEFDWPITSRARRTTGGGTLAVAVCHSCFAAFRTAPSCPYCGVERELTPREIEEREGELAEILAIEARRRSRIEVAVAHKDGLAGMARLAKERGYKPGWLVHRMKLKGQPISYEDAVRAMHG